jgi:RNA polymerase sigma-70 factor, ECF subfamily
VAMYDLLFQLNPSPVIALNRAIAIAMRDGAEAGLGLIDELLAGGELAEYYLAHAARAELQRRLGNYGAARAAYERALQGTTQEPERRFLAQRLANLPIS